MLVRNGISVLLEEAFHLICNIQGVVGDSEGRVTEPWFLINLCILRFDKLVVELLQERLIGSSGETGLFVEKCHDTELALDDVDTRLVVGELDERPIDLLPDIFFLFQLEDMLVELTRDEISEQRPRIGKETSTDLLLQLLVGVVDAELFERILLCGRSVSASYG